MKFSFYVKGNKKKTMEIKVKSDKELSLISDLAKAKIVERSVLKDFDFTSDTMVCDVKGKTYSMRELIVLIADMRKKGRIDSKKSSNKKTDADKKSKSKKKKDKKSDKKKNKKTKSKKNKSVSNKSISNGGPRVENGLIRISRR